MNAKQTWDADLATVSFARGAPMGWSNTPQSDDPESYFARNYVTPEERAAPILFHLTRVYLDCGGYDPAGYYYGFPCDLWEAWAGHETDPGAFRVQPFRFRCSPLNRFSAKAIVRREFPNAVFYR